MPKRLTQAQRQATFLQTGELDLMGTARQEYAVVDLDAVAGTLADLAIQFIELARTNLDAADKISTSALADSIVPTEVEIFGSVYRIEIKLNDYYKFVDEGVKGWESSSKAPNSPYQYKRTRPSKKMVNEIRKWVIREGLKGRGKENRRLVGRRDQKRNKISDTSTATAYAISSSIKRKGLRATGFWTKTATEMEKRVAEEFGKALKIDIVNALTKK